MRKTLSGWLMAGAILALVGPAMPQGRAEWPGWRGANRDGKSPDTGLLKEWPPEGPPLLWKATGIGPGFSSVAVSGGMVYITGIIGGQTVISAFDMEGKRLWQAPAGPAGPDGGYPGSRSSPVIDQGSLFLITGGGCIGCFDARTGAPRWSREMSEFGGRPHNWGYAESVLIYGDLAVVTPGGPRTVVALNKRTGQLVWASNGFNLPAHYGSLIAVEYQGTPMIIAGTGLGIIGVNARNGAPLWWNRFSERNTANCPTPAYADGYVFWANGYGKGGVCINLAQAKGETPAAWMTSQMACHHGGYVIVDGYIYGNHNNGWSCLDLKTGEVKWNDRGVGKGSVCWADGMLYLFSENGGMAGLAPATPDGLRLTGRFRVAGSGPSWAHPVVIGGRLYLRYDDNLYCFNVKAE